MSPVTAITHLHRISVGETSRFLWWKPSRRPEQDETDAGRLYPEAQCKGWVQEDLHALVKNEFGGDLASVFAGAARPAQLELGRACVLHIWGGLYAAPDVQLVHRWNPPAAAKIAGFRAPPGTGARWTDLHPALLWSAPRRPEWLAIIDRVVEALRAGVDAPGSGRLLGDALIAALGRQPHQRDLDEQWIGEARIASPHLDLALVAPDKQLVALQMSEAEPMQAN